MKLWKRSLALFLALLMLSGTCGITVSAASDPAIVEGDPYFVEAVDLTGVTFLSAADGKAVKVKAAAGADGKAIEENKVYYLTSDGDGGYTTTQLAGTTSGDYWAIAYPNFVVDTAAVDADGLHTVGKNPYVLADDCVFLAVKLNLCA